MLKIPFQRINWSSLTDQEQGGESGKSHSRVFELPGLRIRKVNYSAGYLADHWCEKGHIVHCLEGEFITEMIGGEKLLLSAGDTYVVSNGMSSHRSFSENGVKLLIIDGDFLRPDET
jgi:hypothetical protein